jgi:hypothetical protein
MAGQGPSSTSGGGATAAVQIGAGRDPAAISTKSVDGSSAGGTEFLDG